MEPDQTREPIADAATLLGLLADEDRLQALAALALGASTKPDVAAATGSSEAVTVRALGRLAAAGLVVDVDGALRVDRDRLAAARRALAEVQPPDDLPSDPVLRAFMPGERLLQIPAAHGKRQVVLDRLAVDFEPGEVYPERDVNRILARRHDDVAALRRYLVDDGFLERRDGFYWRAGGTVDVD